ncbi:hypothetical protein OPKNFCMD_3800 [Methylobacterium crusticola]|uniref:Pectate lyase superfamily protein domain-containing protein n=2 Tax=Methylobacterium crusticola TaxID=1697972 RepID=A0ABQ4R2E8_9HYPH|nr:hypothetical protein OPKNFCMD_3800 [Methylobacterium crusticola]
MFIPVFIVLIGFNIGFSSRAQAECNPISTRECAEKLAGNASVAPAEYTCECDQKTRTINSLEYLNIVRSESKGQVDPSESLYSLFSVRNRAARKIFVPPGIYALSRPITPPVNVAIEYSAAKFSGLGYIENTSDWSVFHETDTSHAWSRVTDNINNDWGVYSGLYVKKTAGQRSYEKAAGYFSATTEDPSSYVISGQTINVNRDAVGLQANGNAAIGNLHARVWGASTQAFIPQGANGLATGLEVNLTNNSGIDQPNIATPTSKTGLTSVLFGKTHGTSAFFAIAGAADAQWHNGYDVRQSDVIDYAFRLRSKDSENINNFSVTPSGNVQASSLEITNKATFKSDIYARSMILEGDNAIKIASGVKSSDLAVMSTNSGALMVSGHAGFDTIIGSGESDVSIGRALKTKINARATPSGTNQATSREVDASITVLTSGSGGIRLRPIIGERQEVLNRTSSPVLIFPPVGARIEQLQINSGSELRENASASYICVEATQCYRI